MVRGGRSEESCLGYHGPMEHLTLYSVPGFVNLLLIFD
jgi:hypothetical protein